MRRDDNRTSERLRGIVDRVTYKPDWQFLVRPASYEAAYLTVVHMEQDVEKPDEEISVGSTKMVTGLGMEDLTDEQVIEFVVRPLIMDAEVHEIDEWLKLDRKHIRNPHPLDGEAV